MFDYAYVSPGWVFAYIPAFARLVRYLCWFAAPTVYMVGLAYACILAAIWSCVSYQYVITNNEYLMFYICSSIIIPVTHVVIRGMML